MRSAMTIPFPRKSISDFPRIGWGFLIFFFAPARCFCQARAGNYGNGPAATFDGVATGPQSSKQSGGLLLVLFADQCQQPHQRGDRLAFLLGSERYVVGRAEHYAAGLRCSTV